VLEFLIRCQEHAIQEDATIVLEVRTREIHSSNNRLAAPHAGCFTSGITATDLEELTRRDGVEIITFRLGFTDYLSSLHWAGIDVLHLATDEGRFYTQYDCAGGCRMYTLRVPRLTGAVLAISGTNGGGAHGFTLSASSDVGSPWNFGGVSKANASQYLVANSAGSWVCRTSFPLCCIPFGLFCGCFHWCFHRHIPACLGYCCLMPQWTQPEYNDEGWQPIPIHAGSLADSNDAAAERIGGHAAAVWPREAGDYCGLTGDCAPCTPSITYWRVGPFDQLAPIPY